MARQVKFFIFLLFAVAFALQVYQNTTKYLAGTTTVVSKMENRRQEGLDFPSVSVCPGFRSDVQFYPFKDMEKYRLAKHFIQERLRIKQFF